MQTLATLWLYWCATAVAVSGFWILDKEFWRWREAKRANLQRIADGHERLLEDLICGDMDPNVQAIVYKTKEGSTLQWHVPGKTDEQIIQHLTESSLFKRIA